jgi:transcription initiation factor IIE alpha subunit
MDLRQALLEEHSIDIDGVTPRLTGKPRRYYCDEHGTRMAAEVYDPYDVPSFVCSECGESLEFERL